MFYMRADVNEVIATGHVMRCMAIAGAMRLLGEDVTFLVADQTGKDFVEEKGYPAICLNSKWNELETELDTLQELIERLQIRRILVDSYQVTETYLATLQSYTSVIYLDDLDAFSYPCDRIINYAVYAGQCSYAREEKSRGHLLGTSYMPLRQAFWHLASKEVSDGAKHLLVLSGGADTYHFTRDFLRACENDDKHDITVICGRFHPDVQELERMAEQREHVIIKKNVTDIERYMKWADIAISAGGTTLYELCACGTPTISYALADNQMKNVTAFDELGLIPYCGDIRRESCIPQIWNQIRKWSKNPQQRKEVSQRMQTLVDGQGAMRLARELL